MKQENDEFSNQTTEKDFPDIGDIVAFVGHEVQFSGVLTYKGNVRIDGTFDGEIQTEDTLFIGEQANVKAVIKAGLVIASGRIAGNITASQRVELKSPAIIDASITTPRLSMDNGVIFNGKISMGPSIGHDKSAQGNSRKSVAAIVEKNKSIEEVAKPAEGSSPEVGRATSPEEATRGSEV